MTATQDWNAKASQCREQLKLRPSDAYAASQLLEAIRNSAKGASPFPILTEARKVFQQFRADQWVSFRFAWILFDVCKARITQNELNDARQTLDEMIQLVPGLPQERKGGFFEQMARLFHECVKKLKEGAAEQKQLAADLGRLGLQLRPVLLQVLPTAPGQAPDGRPFPSPHDRFLSDLRGALDRSQQWNELRDLCLDVLEHRLQVADEKWFGHSLLKCLPHLSVTPELRAIVDRYLSRHGDDEFVQSSLAEWLGATGDADGARVAFTRSLALAHTPWPWRTFAGFLIEQGRHDEAACCFRAGLSSIDDAAVGKTWSLHFGLSQCAARLGQWEEAATEAQIARGCREKSGWPQAKELEDFLVLHADGMRDNLSRLADRGLNELLQSRRYVYFKAKNEYLRRLAFPHIVTRSDQDRGLVWFRPATGGPDAIYRWRPPKSGPTTGQQVLAITVPSWDRAKERLGLRVAWWAPADQK